MTGLFLLIFLFIVITIIIIIWICTHKVLLKTEKEILKIFPDDIPKKHKTSFFSNTYNTQPIIIYKISKLYSRNHKTFWESKYFITFEKNIYIKLCSNTWSNFSDIIDC